MIAGDFKDKALDSRGKQTRSKPVSLKTMEYDEFRAMNTDILVAAEGIRSELEPGFALIRQFVEESEERFSRFRGTSELSSLNRGAGQWFSASIPMFSLLEEAMAAYHLTSGLFDPTILNALQFAGYDRSMDDILGFDPVPRPREFLPFSPDFDSIELDAANHMVWMPPGMQVDLGGIAKGWIAARAAEHLSQFTGAGAVSAGGDMVMFGLPESSPNWLISLEDPRDITHVLGVLKVGPGAIATSSVTRRRWNQHDQPRHHIIDPRIGVPASSPWLCVTVFTEKATHAEAFAKAMLISGPDDSWNLAGRLPELQFLAVQTDGMLCGNLEITEVPCDA